MTIADSFHVRIFPGGRFIFAAVSLGLALLLAPVATIAGDAFRAVTFNIYLGKGLDENPARFGWYLNQTEPLKDFDVIGMQEVCGDREGEHLRMLRALLRQSGPIYSHFVSSDPNDRKQCGKGQAIFSRHPILSQGAKLLPFVREPRMMVWIDINVKGKPIRVYNLHLDNRSKNILNSERDRKRQIIGALDEIGAFRSAHPEAGVIVLGDFNSWGKMLVPGAWESGIREMARHLDPTLRGFHPTHRLPVQLDWIFFDGLELTGSAVIRRFMGSDHLPVYADFLIAGNE